MVFTRLYRPYRDVHYFHLLKTVFNLLNSTLVFVQRLPCGLRHLHNVAEAMAASLEPPHQKIDLIESAVTCERHLNSLKQHAQDHKRRYATGKKNVLLEDVITRSNGSIQSLKAWTAAFTEGRQTSDESIRASINTLFENILSRRKDAQEALDYRLGLRIWASKKSKYDMRLGCACNLWLTSDLGKELLSVYGRQWMRLVLRLGTSTTRSRPCCATPQIRENVKRGSRK